MNTKTNRFTIPLRREDYLTIIESAQTVYETVLIYNAMVQLAYQINDHRDEVHGLNEDDK